MKAGTAHALRRRSAAEAIVPPITSEPTSGEGLSPDAPHPVQEAWIEHDVPQCRYCQAGQIMTAAVLIAQNPSPSVREDATFMERVP
jgi:aerobic-type carbon monoxide dehydrogenase small subunit (CoxS/CutS family)